ncbi:centriole, cilia and spindle-associated protein [Phyllopteryx taeniolatus]|uniref:centriole, cilia and spindle-associated protein n=1 Tax=Phyllopteryx taeniolatus TaxID=161469 RepID=UPI002AD45934|nr:centriole, cilia and spindle-associated protein [Phyllopteryx taeniolatus]
MVTKKVRTEYMKKFREPKWETFSKCYEDSLKYRLTRRVMEHSHKPWFWEGWEGGSVLSSGRSTPRPGRNRVAPLLHETNGLRSGPDAEPPSGRGEEVAVVATEVAEVDAAAPEGDITGGTGATERAQTTNVASPPPNISGASDELDTDDGPLDSPDSNGDAAEPAPIQKRRRRRTPRSKQGLQDGCHGSDRKPQRAKSQPPQGGARDNPWTRCNDPHARKATTPGDSERCDACVQTTTRPPDKRSATSDRRRARSADVEKLRHSQRHHVTTVADERWVTEYMRCFSARLR